MKKNKKIISKLQELYSTSIDNYRTDDNDSYIDVPQAPDTEYKTHMLFPTMEDVEEPVIKTKKGKTILREPPDSDLDENKPKDIDILDKDGEEIEGWEDIEDLDYSELEEMVNVIDEDFILELKDDKKKAKSDEESDPDEEDDNGMGDLANTNMNEQNPKSGKDPNTQQGSETPDPSQMTTGMDNTQDPNAMGGQQDPTAGMGGMTGLGGMGGDQEIDPMTGQPKHTSEEVGRIFELKKIYSRMLSIESQLSFSSDLTLQKLRKFVSDAIELFETLISNVDAFKDEIDDIIIMYYKFLQELYEILKKYYKNKQSKEEEQIKKNNKSVP